MLNRVRGEPGVLLPIAAILVIAGSVARLSDIDRMIVWHDEVFTQMRVFGFDQGLVAADVFSGRDLKPDDLLRYQRPSPGLGFQETISSLAAHPEHGPLFFLTARLAVLAFPKPLAGVRYTSALLSLLLMPAVFWLARELFEDAKTPCVVTALVACSPLHLLYAQEARQYALWAALTAAASAALLRALRKGRAGDWAIYAILVTLGLYAHLLFAVVLAAHAAYVLLWLNRYTGRAPVLVGWGSAMALAVLLFSPWIWNLIARSERVESVTSWMQRPVPVPQALEAWGMNTVRVFADFPAAGLLPLGLIPLAWVLWRFCVRAPAMARTFVCLLFLPFAAVVLLPDLIQGGSRSLHPRYVLPALLAVELAVAYVIAAGWDAPSRGRRIASRSGLFVVLASGVWSCWLILQAETWWTKGYSSKNREVAELVNATERPLLMVSQSEVALGEALSLAYDLSARVVIRGEPRNHAGVHVGGFSDVFLLTPSADLSTALGSDYDLEPVLGTWQWVRAVPKSKEAGA